MLGCLEVVEYSLKERFNMKYLHQVSYLRLQDVIGVCLSYYCLSGTTYCKMSAVSTTDGWLKPNFASCVVRKTRSLGALVLCSICNMVFANYIYDMVVDTQFHKFHGRPFARVL